MCETSEDTNRRSTTYGGSWIGPLYLLLAFQRGCRFGIGASNPHTRTTGSSVSIMNPPPTLATISMVSNLSTVKC